MSVTIPADRFARVGNNLSADFVNTLYSPDHAEGSLRSANDVIDFLLVTGALEPAHAANVRRKLGSRDDAQAFVASVLRLRDAVACALHAIEGGHALDDDSLATLNAVLASDAGFFRLDRRRGGTCELTYERLRTDIVNVLVPIARETARLLTTAGVPIRKCAGTGCVRHFYDDSRTGRRRWCDMTICGNRAKATAYSERHRRERST